MAVETKKLMATLVALEHLIGGFEGALKCRHQVMVSGGYVDEIKAALDNEFARLKNGQLTSLQENHAHTYPQAGDAPFCGDFNKCNNGEGCDLCKEFEEWVEKLRDNFR